MKRNIPMLTVRSACWSGISPARAHGHHSCARAHVRLADWH